MGILDIVKTKEVTLGPILPIKRVRYKAPFPIQNILLFSQFSKLNPNLKVKINLTGFDQLIAPELLSEPCCNRQTLIAFRHTRMFLLCTIYTEVSSVLMVRNVTK